MMHCPLTRIVPVTLLVIAGLLSGCTGMPPRFEVPFSGTTLQGQCERPLLPDVYDAEVSAWHWLTFSQTTSLLSWSTLPAHPADPELAFAWALYFSQPGQSPIMLQLGIGQLQRLQPSLPDALQPLINLHLNAAQALLLEHQHSDQQRLTLENRIQSLQQQLQQKQAQINALTAIESQLNTRDSGPKQEDTP